MLEIQDTLVSLDLAERYFCCDLEACRGACCIEGDAGAPITEEERRKLEEVLPDIVDDLTPAGRREVEANGVAYVDEEGDLVTSIIDGTGACAFTCYGEDGTCLCAIERACRQGRGRWLKPASCHLYPVRIKEYKDFTAVNLHRWKICRPAERLGRRLGIRAYQFLKEPLIARFGADWYDELVLACEAWLADHPTT